MRLLRARERATPPAAGDPGKSWRTFLPLLAGYLALIALRLPDGFVGDERPYVELARRLSAGVLSPADNVNLWYGPGYPLILIPFVALGWFTAARLLNAILLFAAVLLFNRTARIYMDAGQARLFAYLLGIYPPFAKSLHDMNSEVLAILLVCALMLAYVQLIRAEKPPWWRFLLPSALLAHLALTKVLFGYVIAASLLVALPLFVLFRGPRQRKTLAVATLGAVLCLPYLYGTYSLTGKVFYWGNSGGLSLYWMTSPHAADLGDWHADREVVENRELALNHGAFIERVQSLPSVARDAALKAKAVENIANHPAMFVRNILANMGRLVFDYPYSYRPQKLSTYFYIFPALYLVAAATVALICTVARRREIPYEIRSLLVFGALAFGGSSLLSAYARMSYPLIPIVLLWIAFTFTRMLDIRIRPAYP